MLVGLADTLAARCTERLVNGGLRVVRVGHVAAASERIPVVMPLLVVVSSGLYPEEEERLGDGCVAVGAAILRLEPDAAPDAFDLALDDAANAAFLRSLRRGR
jgi:hypothetical protein